VARTARRRHHLECAPGRPHPHGWASARGETPEANALASTPASNTTEVGEGPCCQSLGRVTIRTSCANRSLRLRGLGVTAGVGQGEPRRASTWLSCSTMLWRSAASRLVSASSRRRSRAASCQASFACSRASASTALASRSARVRSASAALSPSALLRSRSVSAAANPHGLPAAACWPTPPLP
jgi:hypothetical protein